MNFDPKTDKFPYTLNTDGHYLIVKKNNGLVFDDKYPYIDKSKSFRFKRKIIRILLYLIVFPWMRIRLGLKVKGRNNLKKYKEVINKGVISVCNHVHMYDYLAQMYALRPRKTYILSLASNISGEVGTLIRLTGGIPIPANNLKATAAYMNSIKELLDNGGWLHINSEGSMWEYYYPIRPFKKGAATFSVKYNKPIIPMGFSYRKPGFIRRKIFKQIACFTLTIGEPLFPNEELDKKDRIQNLVIRSHEAVCKLANIDPKENLYPPIFDENIKRIDYYTDTYGKNYKGSH